MEEPPTDESPIGSVPKATDCPDDVNVANDFPFVAPASAKRKIDIVAEPRGQRDMPSAPEFRDASREIRIVEVAHQIETEQPRTTDGNV